MDSVVIKIAVDLVSHFVKTRLGAHADGDAPEVNVERHLSEALSWSRRIQFYGMSRAEETEAATIPLRLDVEPRRFRGRNTATQRTEADLLKDDRNYLLLGDPGAGKTTTLKRIVQRLLLDAPECAADHYQFPVVLRLRDMRAGESLCESIATTLGLRYEHVHKDEEVSKKERLKPVDASGRVKTARRAGLWIGNTPLHHVIAEFLNSGDVLLLLDGLDEAPPGFERKLRDELSWLGLNTAGGKIIVSCRTGDYMSVIDGFDLMEICPLDDQEIEAIATAWLSDPAPFIDELAKVPYGDIANRPLLLTQLLFLYKRYGYLPDQPNQVYRKVVSLLLQEWDAERGISRTSRYARFDPERKAAFLAAVAYHLTYKIQTTSFSEAELLDVYKTIHKRFQLPTMEARQVIAELETHTGIIAVGGYDTYEFSHLSLQEYLCADHLVREPHSQHLADYMRSYPAPVAIAVALSSNPSVTFAALFLGKLNVPYDEIASFLARVALERPFFDDSAELGVAIMKLYHDLGRTEAKASVDRLAALPCVLDAVGVGLEYYKPSHSRMTAGNEFIRLERTRALETVHGLRTPDVVYLPVTMLRDLYTRGDAHAASMMSAVRTARPRGDT